jgi:enoyl-CoA hydratase/carnithine racemase
VSRVVSRADIDRVVDEIVDALLAHSPTTLMMGRDSFHAMADAGFDTALDRLQGGLTEIASTEDAREGVAAFIEKRDPEWRDR